MRQKQKITHWLTLLAVVVALLPSRALAATGFMYLSPSSSSVQTGGSVTVALRINPDTTVDGVQATVSYNAGLLQLNSADTSASPFTLPLQKTAGGGVVTVALGNLSGGVSSDALIVSMNFTALAAGTASLSVSGANATSGGSYTNPSASGGTISITAPASSAPTGGATGSTTSGTTSKASSSNSTKATPATAATPAPAPTAETQAVVVQNVTLGTAVTARSLTSASIAVKANRAADIYIVYGTNAKELTRKTDTKTGVTAATLALANDLVPGTEYYYQVVARTADGGQATSPVQQLITKGYTVRVTVLDAQNQPLRNSLVTLHSRPQTVRTDGAGVATFSDVAPGEHHLQHGDVRTVVYVTNDQTKQVTAAVLPAQLTKPVAQTDRLAWMVAAAFAGLSVLLLAAVFRKWLHHEFLAVRHVLVAGHLHLL